MEASTVATLGRSGFAGRAVDVAPRRRARCRRALRMPAPARPSAAADPVAPLMPKSANGAALTGDALRASVVADDNSYLLQNYGARQPMVFTHGKGAKLYDTSGKEYLDFMSGIAVNALGHGDDAWVAAVTAQAGSLAHVSNYYHTAPGAALARRLVQATPWADRAFFCNSGTEANEAAIKFSRKVAVVKAAKAGPFTGFTLPWEPAPKPASELVAFTSGFHGRTLGALSLTYKKAYREPFEPLVPGSHIVKFGDLSAAAAVIVKGKTAAVFVEPVQGEGGINTATAEFLFGLRQLCDAAGAMLVFDEVQCGLGRTGKLWAHTLVPGLSPDILTTAKPLANGLPIGAVLMKQAVADAVAPGDHGSTFAGNPLVCAAAHAVLDRIMAPGFMENVTARGAQFKTGLTAALKTHPHFKEVRQVGLLVGAQFDCQVSPLVGACREAGLLVITAGAGDVLRLVPPLIVTEQEVAAGIDIIGKTAAAVLK